MAWLTLGHRRQAGAGVKGQERDEAFEAARAVEEVAAIARGEFGSIHTPLDVDSCRVLHAPTQTLRCQ